MQKRKHGTPQTQPNQEIAYLRDEIAHLRKELEQRDAVIKLIVKGAAVIEAERDKYQKLADDDVPF